MDTPSINLESLFETNLLILSRETRALLEASAHGKLTKDDALCLRENMKLIMELLKKEKELLAGLSDEELKAYLESR